MLRVASGRRGLYCRCAGRVELTSDFAPKFSRWGGCRARLTMPASSRELRELEAESIFILREVAAEFQRPVSYTRSAVSSSSSTSLARLLSRAAALPCVAHRYDMEVS
jgi:hypothetical protein